MEPIKTVDINQAADEMLQLHMRHYGRDTQRKWRAVRPAAIALLNCAYSAFASNRRGLAQSKRQLREVLRFSALVGVGLPVVPSADKVFLSSHELKEIHKWVRKMLARLVLTYLPDAPSNAACFETPQCKVGASYFRGRADLVFYAVEVRPRYMQLVLASAEVLRAAMPWIRFCEVCSRLFFKVKRQRLCERKQCKQVFHARKRHKWKTHPSERRGRPRIDYAAPTVAEHTRWIRMAYK